MFELGVKGLTGFGLLLRVCIYDRRGWADLKGACVSGVDSWPGLCGRDARVPCRAAALGVGGTAALRGKCPLGCGWGVGDVGDVVPVWCGRDALGSSRFFWGMRDALGSSCFLWGVYECGSGLFSWQMRVRGWVLIWEKGLHRPWVVVGLYGFPPPPSRGQALRGNDEWASGGVGVT